jgi:WS/DGAT/MGAT family acyltransferase
MDKLNFQDNAFLRLESPAHPFHVAGMMVFSPPPGARPGYLRRIVREVGQFLPQVDALFRRKLEGANTASPYWVEASDFDPGFHVQHYALAYPGNMDELLAMLSRTHERLLDRSRPLWEWHVVEGLPRNRFALYCKVHHALIDGVGAMRMIDTLLSEDPRAPIGAALRAARPADSKSPEPTRSGVFGQLSGAAEALLEQGKAIPEVAAMLMRMGRDGGKDAPPLPFTAPHAIMNTDISHRRRLVTANFPLSSVRRIGAAVDGTVNDALVAICGGALRSYLLEHKQLPKQTLLAGIPMSVRTPEEQHGNQLSTIVCSFATHMRDPLARLRHISRSTRQAKQHVRGLSQTARQDYMNMILLPAMVLTMAHAATSVPPAFNVIVSNVPGPAQPLYLGGSRLEEIYPLSLVTDAQALNITAVSCGSKLCLGIAACPDNLPGIERLGHHLTAAYKELLEAIAR